MCFLDFEHLALGFSIHSLEMTLALGVLLFCVSWWRKYPIRRPPLLQQVNFRLVNSMMAVWLLYVFCHTVFNVVLPYSPHDYAFSNLIKVSVAVAAPILLMLFFANRPLGIVVKPNFPKRVAQLLLIGLVVNILIRFYRIYAGQADLYDFANADNPWSGRGFLGFSENPYALRVLTPFSMLFATTFLGSKWMRDQTHAARNLFRAVCVLSVLGAMLGGGRATLLFVLLMSLILLIIRRQTVLILSILAFLALAIAGVNMFRDPLERAPVLVQRSLNWAMVDKFDSSSASIDGSTEWRMSLFDMAIDEWRSDPRIFWFGRATFSYTNTDVLALEMDPSASMKISLRRGATHNLITDLLVTFGITGLVIYFVLYFTLLWFLFQMYRASAADELARLLSFVLLVSVGFSFVYGIIAGATFPMVAVWLYVMLISYVRSAPRVAVSSGSPLAVAATPPIGGLTRRPTLPA
jgi:O-antigen ligase